LSRLNYVETGKAYTAIVIVYYESIKREPKIRGIKKCRCDERLKLKQRNLRASHTLGWSWNSLYERHPTCAALEPSLFIFFPFLC
jgi:hypothetical protein